MDATYLLRFYRIVFVNERIIEEIIMPKRRRNRGTKGTDQWEFGDSLDELRKLYKKSKGDVSEEFKKMMDKAPDWYVEIVHIYTLAIADDNIIPTTASACFDLAAMVAKKRMFVGASHEDFLPRGAWNKKYFEIYMRLWGCVEESQKEDVPLLEVIGLLEFMSFKFKERAEADIQLWSKSEIARLEREKLRNKDIN